MIQKEKRSAPTKEGIHLARLFVGIGNNAADERRLGRHQHVDQVVQLVPEVGADGLEVGHLCGRLGLHHHPLLTPAMTRWWQILLFLGLSGMVGVDFAEKRTILRLLQQIDNGVIDGIAVLVEPSSAVVRHGPGIVDDGKVSISEL